MAIIPPETLELIRSRLDVAELVGESVQLTRAGRNLKGRCPFHQERTPSFIVSPERQTFHCFGCGEGGDAFSFVMKTQGLSFVEAAEALAARAGVKLEASKELSPEDKAKLRMKEALEFAAGYYHQLLKKDPAADAARKYVASRKLSAASVDGFLIGYAPRQGSLVAEARKKGFGEDVLLKSGLAAKRPDGTLRDYFFDRLMFPIRDAKGAFIGFGGRTLGDGEPKYLNSPESPVFSKGRVLYGLFEGSGAVRKARKAHLMEGYMDVIAAHQHGLKTACAALGTALTPEHSLLLKRYVDGAVLVFDADNAGQNAAVRGAEVALASGLGVRIASVPEGKDPDEFLHAKGLAAFEAALGQAVDLVAFKTELLVKRAGELTPEKKSEIAKDVLATIAQCPDEVLKDEWLRRLAARLGVNEDSLRRAGGKAVPQRAAAKPAAAGPAGSKAGITPSGSGEAGQKAGETGVKPPQVSPADLQVLGVLFKAPTCHSELNSGDFETADARAIFAAATAAAQASAEWTRGLPDRFESPAWRSFVTRMLVEENLNEDPIAHFREFVSTARLRRRLRELEKQVVGKPQDQLDPALRTEYQSVMAQLKGSKGKFAPAK